MPAVTALEDFGWDAEWQKVFEPYRGQDLVPGRVVIPHRGAYDVVTESGEARARVSGRLRHEAGTTAELPVVGDWVALEPRAQGRLTVQAVLPRRTSFSRRAVADSGTDAAREHVIAANIDVVFVVVSLGEDVDLRLLERYLTLAWESGARPVILLTKADLEPDPAAVAKEASSISGEVPVVVASTRTGLGLDGVLSHLPRGVTGALLGPSGVGKSTLVNLLAGEKLLATRSLREDGSGRHTTTHRQLVLLPEGGLIVDNPGMRELPLWLAEGGLEDAFQDIVELESQCRFSDCAHESEPGCAIQAALAEGRLSAERWQSYRDLRRELAELEEKLARRERSRARRGRPSAGAS
jgi:ribosome biogenesis GTPase